MQFYRQLHPFLKKWNTTHSLPKASFGRFYLSIDSLLQARNSSPFNTHRFEERVVSSDTLYSAIMPYGDKTVSILQAEIRSCSKQVRDLDCKVAEQQQEIKEMKREMEATKSQLAESKSTIQQVELDKKHLRRSQNCLKKKLHVADRRYESTLSDLLHTDEELSGKCEVEVSGTKEAETTQQLVHKPKLEGGFTEKKFVNYTIRYFRIKYHQQNCPDYQISLEMLCTFIQH